MKRSRWFRPAPLPSGQRKPRILVAGEFSAGKTRLINGLAGQTVLPSNVTATALPPVWLVNGDPALMRVDAFGKGNPIESLAEADLDKTHYCVLSHPAPILEHMDIIDTPGNSDPNMSAETWQRMLTYADAVVWCTNATQAWRQSEKAVWQAMPVRLRQNAILLVTHADLMTDEGNADRVLNRVKREAAPYFDTFRMTSLLETADIDWIGDFLRDLSGRLGEGGGAENALTNKFAAAHPVTAASSKPEPGGAVLQMSRPRADAAPVTPVRPARPTAAAPKVVVEGRARALWNELGRDIDRTNPAALLAGLEALIEALDAPQKTARDAASEAISRSS
jgi:hypothetical protein